MENVVGWLVHDFLSESMLPSKLNNCTKNSCAATSSSALDVPSNFHSALLILMALMMWRKFEKFVYLFPPLADDNQTTARSPDVRLQ